MKIQTALRSTMAQAMIAAMANGSANNPKIEIYDGSMPASMGQTISDNLLAELEMTTTVATESNGVITFDAISPDSSANADGTAGWARFLDRDGAEVLYLTVTETGGGGDLEMNTVSLQAGGAVSITSLTFTVGP